MESGQSYPTSVTQRHDQEHQARRWVSSEWCSLTAVFIAAPGLGHVIPLVQLAYLAAVTGITATFIASDVPLKKLSADGLLPAHPDLRIVSLESTVSLAEYLKGPAAVMGLYQQMTAPTDKVLRELAAGNPIQGLTGGPILTDLRPTVVVSSPFIFFGPPIAKELGLKWTTLIDTSVIGAVVTLKLAADAATKSPEEEVLPDGAQLDQYMDVKPEDIVRVFGEGALTTKGPTVGVYDRHHR